MVKNVLLMATVALVAVSCDKKQAQEATALKDSIEAVADSTVQKADSIVDAHTSQTSLDVEGTYKGVLPCADCEGIETQLVLGKEDYTLTTKYLGKGDGKPFESKGKYTWSKEGDKIVLDKDKTQYKVEENRLVQLDLEGNVITGNLASHYVLTK